MKRTDFLKTLGALIIAPLAINSILKDKGCQPKQSYKDRERIADEDLKARRQYPLTYDECYYRDLIKYSKYFDNSYQYNKWINNLP